MARRTKIHQDQAKQSQCKGCKDQKQQHVQRRPRKILQKHQQHESKNWTSTKMEKFVDFWAGIWEDETRTPNRTWMKEISEKIKGKVEEVKEFEIDKKKLYETLKKRKNWPAQGIDGIPNVWWKKLSGAWKALVRSMNL